MPKISQREARRLRKLVSELQAERRRQRGALASEFVGGVHLQSIGVPESLYAAVLTARKLDQAVVVTCPNKNEVMFYALPLAK